MNYLTVKSKNENHYFISEKDKMVIYIPKKFLSFFADNAISENNKDTYYSKKKAFFQNGGIVDEFAPRMITEYDPFQIKSNLANLRMLLIEVTDECNLSCKYCGYGVMYNNYDIRENKKQKFINVKALIDYLADLWKSTLNVSYNNIITVGFYGGEPLLNFKLIKQIISYLDSLNIPGIEFSYNMTTNGVLLDKYMEYLAFKKFSLLISLDGNERNNSYRTFRSEKPSFSRVKANIIQLREKYPNFYMNNVNINSVLHNKNSVSEIYLFVKKTFDKIPRIAELNTNGIEVSQMNEFNKMFKNKTYNNDIEDSCNEMKTDLLLSDPSVTMLNYFIDAFTSNTYNTYSDLFTIENDKMFIPTGTCQPFNRKIFLTVNGKILPCERVGQEMPIGSVSNGIVDINYEFVNSVYSAMYKDIIAQCRKCLIWKNCTYCIFYIKKKENKRVCDRFIPKAMKSNYCSYYLSLVEDLPNIYNQIIKEITIY